VIVSGRPGRNLLGGACPGCETARVGEPTLRPSRDEDIPAMVDVARRSFLRATGNETHWNLQNLARLRMLPGRDAAGDFPVVESDDRLLAWAGFLAHAPFTELFAPVVMDPDLDDETAMTAATLLFGYVDARAHDVVADLPRDVSRVLATEIPAQDRRGLALAAALGFAPERHEYEMTIDVDPSTPAPPWPDGVSVVAVRGPEDAGLVTDLLEVSFADHPGNAPFSLETITHVLGDAVLNRDASVVAHDDDGPVGLVLCRDRPSTGYVWVIGVVPRARRRGLGGALLQHAFHRYATLGRTTVELDVDGGNDSGALTVYARAGMTVRTDNMLLTRPIAP
jgi:ribosomal protein S18 acetylase RimI-like enzyme